MITPVEEQIRQYGAYLDETMPSIDADELVTSPGPAVLLGPVIGQRRPRWATGLVVAVVVAVLGGIPLLFLMGDSDTLTTPLPSSSALPKGRTVNIERIDISADSRTIALGFIGHAHPEGSPCSEEYEGWARTSADGLEVAVVVTRERGEGIAEGGTIICTSAGRRREVVINLAEPFTGSQIRDIAGYYVLFLSAPDNLAELTGLPEGWELRTESEIDVPFGAWSRIYSPVIDPTEDDPRVEFVQASELPEIFVIGRYNRGVGPPDFGFDSPRGVTVGGVQGSLYQHSESGDLILVWQPVDDDLVLVVNQGDFTVEGLIALAEGTRVPGSMQ